MQVHSHDVGDEDVYDTDMTCNDPAVSVQKSRSAYISQLRAALLEWSPFIADSLDICAERTRRRKAVLFTSRHVLEWYEHAFRGQVEISNDFWLGSRPMCYVLPRASPYENAVQNA
ncbi:hypothetical protein HPB52_015073 [Rhipicephalus sanguineus]|uniref:Uncharacterized protein n=1 Tax=Rhipicephalus sanguineus TaxID=34632 RepID=A0A9D4Q0H7_RHISA|nr:hypothetical protein HPB52_015073 [Rhipicephalus sanguineus]